jgi:MFS transporter, DHA2 family, multidrug resistance protein
MLAFGMSMFAVGLYLNTFLTAESSFWELFLPQAVRGFSLMFCFIPVNMLALGTLPPEKLNNASGLYNLMRNLGGAVGLAAINTVVDERMALHWSRLTDGISEARPGVRDFLDGVASRLGDVLPGDATLAATKLLSQIVQREALILSFNDCLLLMGLVFVGGVLLMPLARKPKQAAAGAH